MKPTNAILRQRIDEILEIRLCGATTNDVRRYVAEKESAGEQPWAIPDGGRPVSERTLWRYVEQSEKLMAESCRESRKRLLRRHLAQRKSLFAKAVNQGDLRTALSVLRDEAELQGLYDFRLAELEKRITELEKAKGQKQHDDEHKAPATDKAGQEPNGDD